MGAERAVKGHNTRGASATVRAMESYSVREFSKRALGCVFDAFDSPAAKHDGHHTPPLKSTAELADKPAAVAARRYSPLAGVIEAGGLALRRRLRRHGPGL
jgi:hypothetical protein